MEKAQTVLFLIRHGQTNNPYKVDQSMDGERVLSEEGRAQIEKVGEYLKAFAPTAIYTSPLKRTVQTAEIIKRTAEISGEISEEKELMEVYTPADYRERPHQQQDFFQTVVKKHAGQPVVLVSHQRPMEDVLALLGFMADEIAAPCLMGQGYRLVFAGNTPVECQKINPAKV